jgi:hypothetical protein
MKHGALLILLTVVAAYAPRTLAQENFGAEFAAFKAQYDARVKTDVQLVYEVGVADLNVKYLATLDRALDSAMKGGKLEEAVALKSEKEIIKTGGKVPDKEVGKPPASLVQFREVYRTAMKRLETDRTKRLQPLQDNFARSLEAVVTHLMKEGKLTEAAALKKYRDALVSAPVNGRLLKPEQLTAKNWKFQSALTAREWTFNPDQTLLSSSGTKGAWTIKGNVLQVLVGRTTNDFTLEVHRSGGEIMLKGKSVDSGVGPQMYEATITQSAK